MLEHLPAPAPLLLPKRWAHSDASTLVDVEEAAAALRSGLPHAWVEASDEGHDSDFGPEFWSRLNGPQGHVMVKIPPDMPSAGAATLVAAWMGLAPAQVHDHIGGTVSHVVSGVGHRHDQSWHTDSTPWLEPNRYSVLGLLAGAETEHHSTDLLAITSLHQGLASDPAAWTALRTEPVAWRRNFPRLSGLAAPVLGASHPRWVWPVLEALMDEFSPELQRGVSLMARLVNEVAHYAPVVNCSNILIFDNGRMLHRGPHLEASSGRELIRIKVVGEAGVL